MKEVCNFIAILIPRSTRNRPDNFGLYLIPRKIENLVEPVQSRDDVYMAHINMQEAHVHICS